MIIVEMQGNLGNQLFQYACARNVQEKTGQKICLNLSNIFVNRPDVRFSLDSYVLNDKVEISYEKLPWYADTYFPIIRIAKKYAPKLLFDIGSRYGVYVSQSPLYNEIKISAKDNYYLSGFWQSEQYFSGIRNVLIKEIQPKEKPMNRNVFLYTKIKETESVCVTIRRGDYISNEKFKKIFYICNENYFNKAVIAIKKSIPQSVLFVFSDDIEWVKHNISFPGEVYFESGQDPAWEKLRLMSSCKHFILSNSSFSWWAQYLSLNENKIVYAPNYWLASKERVDIYQPNWRLIEAYDD